MKKIFSLSTVLFIIVSIVISLTSSVFAQVNSVAHKTSVQVISDDGETIELKFQAGVMNQQAVTTPNGNEVIIKMEDGTPILRKGYPDLPKFTTSMIIPDDKEMEITVLNSNYSDYENIPVAPSKGTISRTIDPATVPYTYNSQVYGNNNFFPKAITELRDPYILRDFRGQTVIFYPFQYNPETKTLRVYSDITIKVSPKASGSPKNVLIRTTPLEKVETEFNNVYKNHFINYGHSTRYDPLDDHGNMLIISHASYMEEMQPFIDWKIQEGMKTEIVDVATVGNNKTDIKNYVSEYYNTHGLTFLLLVGDHAEVNTSSVAGAGDSDNEYGYILGNDHYQEIFVGRFSAQSESEVTTQVNRTIEYEKNPLVDAYYSNGVCIASNEGPGDDNEMDWEHGRNLRTQLLDYTYTDVQELFDGTHSGGNDASGNPNDASLAALVNAGTGNINYTGHGDVTLIVTTGFNNSDVDALTNTHEWPFITIVGCQTGNFKNYTCFAEKWARHTYGGNPSGSIVNFMSTINQYWDEPMEGQDEMNNILVEAETDNIKRTFGGIAINGCFGMNDAYGGSGEDMTDTWVIFGDPSVMIRTAEPTNMTVSHDPAIILGISQFNVNCDFEEALVAITQNGIILGTANVNGGFASVQFDNPLTLLDDVLITITGFNKIPYIATVPVAQPNGPYIINTSDVMIDAAGNNNGLADYDENITLDVTLENVGSATAQDVTATLATTDPYISITDETESFGDMSSGLSLTKSGAFMFDVAANVPDGHVALFVITMNDNSGNTWTTSYALTLNAPVLSAVSFVIDDSNGNGDGYLDPGETATITINNSNDGHSSAINVVGSLTESSPYVDVLTAPVSMGNIAAGGNVPVVFTVQIAGNAPYGLDVPFTYAADAGAYSITYNFVTTLAPAIEDFETGDLTKFEWEVSGDADWVAQTLIVYEGSYASRSGNIDNHESSTLLITLEVQFDDDISFMSKLSSEAGYDSLAFRIDDISYGHWSGELEWQAYTFPVSAGMHTFEWTFVKDGGMSNGYDCAFIDNIMLPAFQLNPATNVVTSNSVDQVSAYPNPFESLTFINYRLEKENRVTVEIYDVTGKQIKTILNSHDQPAGSYQLGFDGSSLASGTYFCSITIGDETYTQQLVLSK